LGEEPNLLLVILGAANLAEDLVNRPQEVLRQLKAVQEASQKAANLVRQLVAYAGRRTLVVEQIDISELAVRGESQKTVFI